MVPIACHEDGDCVLCYVNEILDCYYKLSQSSDLKPSPSINYLFERLVALYSQIPSDTITSQVCHPLRHPPTTVPYINEHRFCQTPKLLT